MTDDERVTGLQGLGYTGREAAFLGLAVLHSGYFLRRQYLTFTGTCKGRVDDLLVRKVIERGHGLEGRTGRHTRLYHLCSRTFYNLIDESDNRNRRAKSPFAIKAKLMALDFVLEHPDYRFLATEHEKVALFTGDLGLSEAILPTKIYRSKTADSVTKRHFVDKFPIFVCTKTNPAAPQVGFCYIDEGAVATPGFETYLDQYSGLFAALGYFRLVYVATSAKNFPEAQEGVERLFGPAAGLSSGVCTPSENLDQCFRLEHLLRAERFGELNAAMLDRLKQLRKVFQGSRYEELFALWMTHGDRILHEYFRSPEARLPAPKCSLSLHRLAYDYDLFGYGN